MTKDPLSNPNITYSIISIRLPISCPHSTVQPPLLTAQNLVKVVDSGGNGIRRERKAKVGKLKSEKSQEKKKEKKPDSNS